MNQFTTAITPWKNHPNKWLSLAQILIIAIAYFGSSYLSLKVATLPGFVSPLWPGAGIALAAVLRLKIIGILGVMLGNFSLQLVLHGFTLISLLTNFGNGMAAVIEAVLAAYLLQRVTHHRFNLNCTQNVFFFFILAVVFSSLIGAILGVTTLCLTYKVPWSDYFRGVGTWWLGDAIGILIITPFILAWTEGIKDYQYLLRTRLLEGCTLLFLVTIVTKISFEGKYPLEYTLIALLVWASFRFGQAGATLLVTVLSIISVIVTVQGKGSFIRTDQNELLLLLQSFVGVMALTTLALSAVIQENEQAKIKLTDANATLEDKVEERTSQLAAANQKISILNRQLQAENLRLSTELDLARTIQQLILPKPEEMKGLEDLDIAGFMEPATEVGGDYYDVLYYDGIVTIAMGDVTGHGLESGMLMIMTQTVVRTLQEIRERDPVRFLDTLNRTIYHNVQRMNTDKNLTLVILNYAQGELIISGQHEEMIVVRHNGDFERIDTIDLGFPIGLEQDITSFIHHQMVELNPGDGIVLYTDGITEAENIQKELYGLERLCDIVSQNWQNSAEKIKRIVIDDVKRHIDEHKIFDDLTLLILKRQF